MTPTGPPLDQLKMRLTGLLAAAVPFNGILYRSSTPKYAIERDLLTGMGSKRDGGRWNPIGVLVVYASLTPETAMAETLAHNRYFRIPVEDAMPRTFVAIKARLQVILDLRVGHVRQRLQVSLDRILTVDWRKEMLANREPITQALGRAAYAVGWEGLIVPSAADPEGNYLLVFPENLRGGSPIAVLRGDRLRAR
jgi:RES domain-containing protein